MNSTSRDGVLVRCKLEVGLFRDYYYESEQIGKVEFGDNTSSFTVQMLHEMLDEISQKAAKQVILEIFRESKEIEEEEEEEDHDE